MPKPSVVRAFKHASLEKNLRASIIALGLPFLIFIEMLHRLQLDVVLHATIMVAIVALFSASAFLFPKLVARCFTNAIGCIASSVNRIADGDHSHCVAETKTEDLAAMQTAVNRMKDQLVLALDDARECAERSRLTNDRLKELVQEQSRKLIEAERIASIATLVAGMVHEMNTPLGVSLTAASYLSEVSANVKLTLERSGNIDPTILEYATLAQQTSSFLETEIRHSKSIIDRFITTVSESVELAPEEFDFRAFLGDVLLSLRSELADVSVTIDSPVEIIVRNYPKAWFHVLEQLMRNAVDHAFHEEEHPAISIGAKILGDRLELTVTDNGAGVPPMAASRIFDPFFTTRIGQHIGIGLSIVHNIVSFKLKGTILHEAPPQGGSRFIVSAPMNLS